MPNPVLMRRLGSGRKAPPFWWVDSFNYELDTEVEQDLWGAGDETTGGGEVYFLGFWAGSQSYVPAFYGIEDFSSYPAEEDLAGLENGFYWGGPWGA